MQAIIRHNLRENIYGLRNENEVDVNDSVRFFSDSVWQFISCMLTFSHMHRIHSTICRRRTWKFSFAFYQDSSLSTAKSRVNYMVMQLRLNWNCFLCACCLLQWKVISFVVSKFGNLGQFTRRRDVRSVREHVFHVLCQCMQSSHRPFIQKSRKKNFSNNNEIRKIRFICSCLMLQWISYCFEYSILVHMKLQNCIELQKCLGASGMKNHHDCEIFSFAIRTRNSLIAFSRRKRFDMAIQSPRCTNNNKETKFERVILKLLPAFCIIFTFFTIRKMFRRVKHFLLQFT